VATEGLLGGGAAIPITQLMATRGNAAPATVSTRLIAEAAPQVVSERPASAVLVPVSQTPSASVSLQSTEAAARTPSSRSSAAASPASVPAQVPEAPPAGTQPGGSDAQAAPAQPSAAPVPSGAAPVPAQSGESPQSDDPASGSGSTTPPAQGPSSRGLEPDPLAADSDTPRLVTGLRARLTGVYAGLSDRFARWLDRGEEARVLNASDDDRAAEAAPESASAELGADVGPVAADPMPTPNQIAQPTADGATARVEG